MAPRGFLDYFRAIGVLGRGMVVNFLIFLPFLLLLAIPVAAFHHWMLAHPFVLTATSAAATLVWVLLSPVVVQLFRVAAFRRSIETGNESSVKQRDRYERSFGAPLVVILLLAAVEIEPWILEFIHSHLLPGRAGWPGGVAVVSAGLATLGVANPLLSVLSGFKRQLGMAAVGLLGLLIPLAVVLSAVDFLLYGVPPSELWALSPLVVPIVGIAMFAVALVLGLRRRAFTGSETVIGVGVLVAGMVFAAGAVLAHFEVAKSSETSQDRLEDALNKVHELAEHIGTVSNRSALVPEAVSLVGELVQAGRRAGNLATGTHDVGSALPLVSLAGELATVAATDLSPLKQELGRLARGRILEQTAPEGLRATVLRQTLLRTLLEQCAAAAGRGDWDPPDGKQVDCLEWQLNELDSMLGEDLALLLDEDRLYQEVEKLFSAVPEKALTARLSGREELERLLTRPQLAALVREGLLEERGKAEAEPYESPDDAAVLVPAKALALARLARPAWRTPPPEAVRRLAIFRQPYSNQSCAQPPGDATAASGLPAGGPDDDPVAGETLVRYLLRGFDRAHLEALFDLEGDDPPANCRPPGDRSWQQGYQVLKRRFLPDAGREFDEAQVGEFVASGSAPLEELVARAFPGTGAAPLQNASAGAASAAEAKPYLFTGQDRPVLMLAGAALNYNLDLLARLAAAELLERALWAPAGNVDADAERTAIVQTFATHDPTLLSASDRLRVWLAARLNHDVHAVLATKLTFGALGTLEPDRLAALKLEVTRATFNPKALFLFLVAAMTLGGVWVAVDVNLTSIHGLFRDRLATAFLMSGARRTDGRWEVDIADDVDLHRLAQHRTGSTAPYHILNVALNLQQSRDVNLRDRQSDFFIFSKRFVGGARTGYCRSERLEQVFPQMDLGTAMAVSAGAASPNMGRASSPMVRVFMTLLNVRLGFWVPNPGRLEGGERPGGFGFDEVFREELKELAARWAQVPVRPAADKMSEAINYRRLREGAGAPVSDPDVDRRLTGLGFSGGGIRSASINLGITQVLDACGIFTHVDYMSTVSGGGCLGSSISTLMRTGGRDGSGERSLEPLLGRAEGGGASTMTERFRWRVPARAFIDEMLGRLHESGRWVNVSDGGHIENLAGMELLRRRCKYVILGDGEADPAMHFGGLAALMRYAWIDLGIRIDINLDPLRLRDSDDGKVSAAHHAFGTIVYPELDEKGDNKTGSLLYLKSSYTSDESEIIREYRHRDVTFPHQTTTDQCFDEDQFEAYRALGEHIARQALASWIKVASGSPFGAPPARMSFTDFEEWMKSETATGAEAAQSVASAPASA